MLPIHLADVEKFLNPLYKEIKIFPQNMNKLKDGIPTKPVRLLRLYGLGGNDLNWVFDKNGYIGVILSEQAANVPAISNFVSRYYSNSYHIGNHILRLKTDVK